MKSLLSVLCLLVSLNIHAESFLPENDMYIGVDDKSAGGITEEEFDEVITKIDAVYKPIIKKELNKELVFERNWSDGTVNAYANQQGTIAKIAMFGGLARSKEVTYEGFALVVCHEMGHHLGGSPYWSNSVWAAAEGQADYFSTLKCFKRVFRQEKKLIDVEAIVTDKCEEVFSKKEDINLCERSVSGGQSLATLLSELSDSPIPSILTPSTKIVTKTLVSGYPEIQSRLDSYVAGSLCDVSEFIDVSKTDETLGVCNLGKGSRPKSWYKSKYVVSGQKH